MAEKSRQTVFQKLSSIFSDNRPTDLKTDRSQVIGVDREILRTKSKEEYETKKLEGQQNSYIRRIWNKANNLIKHQTLQNEARRFPSYIDYEKMEEYPLIGAALDIFMEESTTANEKGDVLNIYSNSDRVKKELKILFNDRLNVNTNLAMWSRNMCKFGDNFVYLDVDADEGIIGCKQLPNVEIERNEGEYLNYIVENQKQQTLFIWRTMRTVEFKSWQIAHFRLLTDDRKLPYGVSILEKARRVWRNLLLTEDAMRTIRLIRASDRRIFYVNVGNTNPEDTEALINAIADRYKRKKIVDPSTGQEDIKMNVMGIDQDYIIPIRGADDGSKIETLAGQTNLDIADIEYDLKLLATALRVPKTYLNFDEAVAEGKSLSMQDIRFARTVNRVQQALLHELNKIAIVHLIAIGLEDEIHNFSLSLNNPSIQADLLRTELLQNKLSVYKDATEPLTNGIAPMSHTKAKKELLNMSDNEIKDDLIQQRFEKALGAELLKTEQIIQRTGFFDEVDKLYGVANAQYTQSSDGNPLEGGGGGGGGSFGGGMGDLDSGASPTEEGGLEGGEGDIELGSGDNSGAPEGAGDEALLAPDQEELSSPEEIA